MSPMIPGRNKLTVLDVQNLKGKEQVIMTASGDPWVARMAEAAGVHILRCWGWGSDEESMMRTLPMAVAQLRKAAPKLLLNPLLLPSAISPSDADAIRWATVALGAGADIVLMLGVSPDRVAAVAKQKIPVFCHVGLTPIWYTNWTGGYVGVGKTAQSALKIYKDALAYQEAGAAMITIELTPQKVTAEIAKRIRIPVISIGAGAGADGVELVANDLLGLSPNPIPRHAKQYRQFFNEGVSAYKEFAEEIKSGAFPAQKNAIAIKDEEFAQFVEGMDRIGR
jgi:3-methyl-2-oxobutanoate hydroxymethyltransferase